MDQIGRKIYYELSTGNVILDTGERQGSVVETTEEQDFQMYAALQKYQQNAVGVLQLSFGDYAQNFATYPYHVDITQTPPAIAWDTANPIGATLADVQTAKIAQLRNMYNQTLAAGFNVTIGSTQYTFGWTTDDITHMDATQNAVAKGFLTFPVQYADVNGSPVSIPDQTTLDSIESTATKFMTAQHQQVLNLIGQVQSPTATTSSVNAIQWTPATY
ncbi:hypothetical protein [Alicyclobacillus dauci]|uniref:DUF4376 domain-containing protein n=1 Tax=Alicyclobacillus dauci TaxID=1475485 RepID=A0ABY6YXV3_9BACL|nr:hypothetical protein [Alicyclobacillus dauci]WAH35058.1 hypothetical protein NZD86_12040 [Alicyclobacillus dauci]